jgi:ubiquinone biosynthesis monooxygenase Coq7
VTIEACLRRGETLAGKILRVDHAGEHGAVNIYKGQVLVCRWLAPELVHELCEFQLHEERHRLIFTQELASRGIPRCHSYALCGLGGYVLGVVTALLGRSAIAATTSAVEHVVLRHLNQQLLYLQSADRPAFVAIRSIVDDEQSHHDRAALAIRQGAFWPRLITPIVRVSTETVIWLGMRL